MRCSDRRGCHGGCFLPPPFPHRAAAAPASAVAELGVVRRFHLSSMNVNLSPFPLRELVVSLGGCGFGVSRSLAVSANAFCSRQRKEASPAPSSRRGERFSKVWRHSASPAMQAFGDATRVLKSESASGLGSVVLRTPTPNHALQRTRAAVTPAASGPPPSPPAAQRSRQPRGSLSLRAVADLAALSSSIA